MTEQQKLIIEEIKILISLHINRLQQCGMSKQEAEEETIRGINYMLKNK